MIGVGKGGPIPIGKVSLEDDAGRGIWRKTAEFLRSETVCLLPSLGPR
jgi:hypothetical protein